MSCQLTSKKHKTVSFNLDNNIVFETYSKDDYDRRQIYSTLWRKAYNRITFQEWRSIYESLNKFKCEEMIIHKDSIGNINIHPL